MYSGGAGFRPNIRIATILTLEANLGIRIEDILSLHLNDIVRDCNRYLIDIIEEKIGKKRVFSVTFQIHQYISDYCDVNYIYADKNSYRVVQKYLKTVADYLGREYIGTHSFRKYYASDIYEKTIMI